MKDILVKRLFWVVLGLIVLGLVLFHLVWVRGLARRNQEIRDAIEDKVSKMEKYANKLDIKNKYWIAYAEERRKRIEEATKECEDYLTQNLKLINSRFLQDPEDPGAGVIKDRAHWKERYNEERAALVAKLRKAGIEASRESFDLRDFGDRVPTTEDIDGEKTPEGVPQPGAQKEFWLHAFLVDCLVNVTPAASEEPAPKRTRPRRGQEGQTEEGSRVQRLIKIAIQRPQAAEGAPVGAEAAPTAPGPEGAPVAIQIPSYELVDNTYLVIPFTLTVTMDWRYAPLLIRNMLTSPWPFYVITLDAKRPRRGATEKAALGQINPSAAELTIRAVALDFTPMRTRLTPAPVEPAKALKP